MEKIKQIFSLIVHVALLAFKVAKRVLKIVVHEMKQLRKAMVNPLNN